MNMNLPLEGIKVVELATVVAAPTAGRILSDYGAEVIKIEMPPAGDLLRVTGKGHQLPTDPDNNPLFDLFNSGKKLTSINLKSPEGKEVLYKLLEDADIFISNTRMRSLVKMGLGYEDLKAKFPKLIYAHFSGFGLRGEDVDRPGFDVTAFWLRSGGAMDFVAKGQHPIRPTYGFGDIATASSLLSGILMALIGREKTGEGTLVSTSLFTSGIWCNAAYVLNSQEHYGKQYPTDLYEHWDPFSDYYQCSDGKWLAVIEKVYAKDKHIFADIFDMPELLTDPDMDTLITMREAGKVPAVTKKVEAAMLTKSSSEWQQILDSYDIPNELGLHYNDVYKQPQAWANNCLEEVDYPEGKTAMPMPPIEFSAYGRKPFSKVTDVGGNTEEVLKAAGYTEEEIQALREKGAIY